MNHLQKHLSASLIALAALLAAPIQGAWAAGLLGSAESFAVLGATTVTTAGPSALIGDLGVSPGTACTGFPAPCTASAIGGTVSGTIYAGGSVALQAVSAQAQKDAHIAYAALLGQACTPANNLTGKILGTDVTTLPSGVYCFDTSAQLTGTLTLTGAGPWIFQIGSTLTTATNSSVVMSSGSGAGGVFWLVGSSATLGTGTQFAGNILAVASISLAGGDTVAGRLIALAAAVTMDGPASTVNATANPTGSVPVGNPPFCEEHKEHKKHEKCNQGVGNGHEGCDPGHSDKNPWSSNDENGGKPGDPGRKGGNK